ncbi:MAG: hypothetical protein LQ352_008073 [Teloschistes flavicans]|nr:MAG: hypothetical protein LQ352_008073 [Teloschistes flavicans]
MEAEKKRPSRRERRGSRSSARPDKPPLVMPVDQPSEASAPEPDTKQTIARSMSRYKGARPRYPRSTSTPSVPALPPILTPPQPFDNKGRTRPTTTTGNLRTSTSTDDDDQPLFSLRRQREDAATQRYRTGSPQATTNRVAKDSAMNVAQHGVARDGGVISFERPKEPSRRRGAEGSQGHDESSRTVVSAPRGLHRDRLVTEQAPRSQALPTRPAVLQKKTLTQKIAGLVNQPQSATEAKAQLKQMISNPIPVNADDPSSVVQFDAPKSAVNAGERTVRVKHKDFRVPVTVVPSTTPVDVVQMVADKVGNPIHPDTTVVLESFKQLGLERPLRKYEHIRDVLNSWDDDAQNTLIIETSATGGNDDDLNIKNVPRKQPEESSFYLYHSQRPGHWEKRTVTLRPDGQMLVAKSNGSESSNICHLSDFDIYIPTARQMAKKIRPPKRVCFAVKSQQKSNMFMSTVNFVHFFSSNDKGLARSLYTAIQEWRSWYLVKKMGRGVEQSAQSVTRGQAVPGRDVVMRPVASTKALPNSTRPLLPLPRTSSDQSQEVDKSLALHEPLPSMAGSGHTGRLGPNSRREHDRQALPSSQPKPLTAIPTCEAPFIEGGLLDRTYTQRKKAQQQTREEQTSDVAMPQIPAPSSSPIKVDSFNGLKRNSSQRQKPKPLVDLTPKYQEPPQHTRKGRGVTPGQIPAGGLVDIATSPEVAIPIPPTTSWRRPGTSSGTEVSPQRIRSHS